MMYSRKLSSFKTLIYYQHLAKIFMLNKNFHAKPMIRISWNGHQFLMPDQSLPNKKSISYSYSIAVTCPRKFFFYTKSLVIRIYRQLYQVKIKNPERLSGTPSKKIQRVRERFAIWSSTLGNKNRTPTTQYNPRSLNYHTKPMIRISCPNSIARHLNFSCQLYCLQR